MSSPKASGDSRLALSAGVVCFFIWGFVPLAFQAIGKLGVGPWETLSQRIVWSVPAATVFVLLAGQYRQVLSVLRQPKVLAWLALSSLLIAINWVVFISAVTSGRLLETSLGYYINPLVNMAAGALIFREKIDRIGLVAIGLALVGVVFQAVALGHLPWISLILAFSFAGYGVVRKQVAADAQTGLLVECLILGLPSLAFIVWLQGQGQGHFTQDVPTALWLIASGPITAVPLVLFSWAARRIPLSAIGFLQFLAPTISFVIGLTQGEAFTTARAISFGFIWCGAAVFLYGAWRRSRTVLRAQIVAEAAAE
ncbi:MAG: EamA family transporter RarD [Alphaproteobacteria bacterium]|nr:EamA family transporter RarD [Alphaproteobacteria bacterium]MBU1514916.1 EamA family transporter RarD [Alphaproteobacteria bacterium]MBU2093837.1 EamA family transporter RarD [Alphaproteobacteria bacterium]MBU2154069.1 EamA family transporter RarD [Alphaproteobacteria bacterium]MBU2305418.1 EamA family transporter RarD [Alphaproteobacteria bacterium]